VAINAFYTVLPSSRQKAGFIESIDSTLTRVQTVAVVYLMLFLGGFLIMGYIKLWTYAPQEFNEPIQIEYSFMFGWVQFVGGVVAFAVIISGAKHIRALQMQMMMDSADEKRTGFKTESTGASSAQTESTDASSAQGEPREENTLSWEVYSSALNSIANDIAFQTGNVFYEILFSEVGKYQAADYLYFGLSALTLVLGCIGLAAASLLLFWGNAVRSSGRDHLVTQWVHDTWPLQRSLKRIRIMSLISWECSMLFSSAVKYPKLWFASFGWSALGLALLCASGLYTRLLVQRRRSRRHRGEAHEKKSGDSQAAVGASAGSAGCA